MNRLKIRSIISLVVLITCLLTGVASASPDSPIGGSPVNSVEYAGRSESLSRIVSEFGRITLSLDALGTTSSSGKIQVEKPAGATVRKAYLMSATTGFTETRLSTGDVKIQGNNVVWEKELRNSIESYNYWSDVTSIVRSHIDAAPAGIVNLTISEKNSINIDGEILVVIFDDPSQTIDNTILLHFGAQNVNGDSFVIDLGTPIDKNDSNFALEYSLGISYGCQGSCGNIPVQYSRVDVNGRRLTTSAGGQDDGALANGALITVGGIGDSNANPPNPNATPTNARSDDELYNLEPFVNDGDKTIKITTLNPSVDDNIMFASVVLGATRSVGTVDVDITLHSNPTTSEARAPYETIVEYFADGVFEASNGAHKLGTVTFSTSNSNSAKADVVWVEKCHPNAWPAGIAHDGQHVNMCDIFEEGGNGGSDYNFLSNENQQRMGGYTLAHEWGHYYYGLYDEYVGKAEDDKTFHFPHSTDKAVTNSIMNRQWNAYSSSGDNFNWLNFSIAKNNTKKTAQHRVYGASAWETLIRPVADDPQDGERSAQADRVFYSELGDVDPEGNQDSSIELPGDARSVLRIVWPGSSATVQSKALQSGLPFEAQLSSVLGQNISYPDPILLMAFVHKDWMITDMDVQGSVQLPDGSTKYVTFSDDGNAPDALKGDGVFSAIIGYEEDGIYSVQVQFSNDAGTAKFVTAGVAPAVGIDGAVSLPESIPVAGNFSLSKMLQISVSNTTYDDYGNVPSDAASIAADNVPVSGKIDYARDKDVFRLTTLDSGGTYIRVSNLALGMNPNLRIFGPDRTTILFEAELDDSFKEYVFIPLAGVSPGTVVYAEVSDTSSAASGGLYEVSAGAKLVSDSYSSFDLSLPAIFKT